ncbi:hypothetical protein B0H63DRAFT_531847 [Podospora didyma]|uniref:2EXR domain-containing protein n=1 Tax=Podospora didyma TaxID=330526 RepID=A0AAE0U7J5_9PEZI|nr:hypothetical protein B0H63DRAFT_531847 [Podospora didyma]
MESKLDTFPRFRRLAVELRLLIWEAVEQPTRLIGQLPFYRAKNGKWEACAEMLPGCSLRYVVQPRSAAAIFAPLHACHESRQVWLRRYHRLPGGVVPLLKFSILNDDPTTHCIPSGIDLCLSVPFVNYDKDIFIIHDTWTAYERLVTHQFDPFQGLDCSRIQNVAVWCDSGYTLTDKILGLHVKRLPSLRSASLVISASYFEKSAAAFESKLDFDLELQSEFELTRLLELDSELRDIPQAPLAQHERLVDLLARYTKLSDFLAAAASSCEDRQQGYVIKPAGEVELSFYTFKGWLWHIDNPGWNYQVARHYQEARIRMLTGARLSGWLTRVAGGSNCPLRLTGCQCGPGGHSQEEVRDWVPPYEIGIKVLGAAEQFQ